MWHSLSVLGVSCALPCVWALLWALSCRFGSAARLSPLHSAGILCAAAEFWVDDPDFCASATCSALPGMGRHWDYLRDCFVTAAAVQPCPLCLEEHFPACCCSLSWEVSSAVQLSVDQNNKAMVHHKL